MTRCFRRSAGVRRAGTRTHRGRAGVHPPGCSPHGLLSAARSHPYDGGADVILPMCSGRDALKERHRTWLSNHPSGF
ncbi:DUF3885 domain-containing protein [Microtetraspora malaysiensis]|uniref:DUF3885 domain-containing protein n=1 Tax=Microtetraspora malaysiensis TaxID=161358 RepID=UPI003D8CEAE6